MNRHVTAAAIAAAILPAGAWAQSTGPTGQALVQTCYVCHGPDGKSEGPIPPLAGLPEDHIARQMTDFKADRLPGTIMNRIARSYTDEQIAAIAKVIATLK